MDFYRQHQLPETVRRYKTATQNFQDWLVDVAKQRQVELNIVRQAKAAKKSKKSKTMTTVQHAKLVAGIVKSQQPLEDTSGLQNLDDAIRSRKEVAQYHKLNHMVDEGHTHFNSTLMNFKTLLGRLAPVLYALEDPKNKSHEIVFVEIIESGPNRHDEEEVVHEHEHPEKVKPGDESSKEVKPSLEQVLNSAAWTTEEIELDTDLLILQFLYVFNRIRRVVSDVWCLYRDKHISAMTAALVTDLAQSHIQQWVTTLVEESEIPVGTLGYFVVDLFEKLTSKASRKRRTTAQPSRKELRRLFCISTTDQMQSYYCRLCAHKTTKVAEAEDPFMLFLQFFDKIRTRKIQLPVWDKFSESMLIHRNSSKDWLPFGLAIVVDINEILGDESQRIFDDTTEHCLDISTLIRMHTDYETNMWNTSRKQPDYDTKEDIKFSTVFLNPLGSLLNWLEQVVDAEGSRITDSTLSTGLFVELHSTQAGLIMYHFNTLYHHAAIGKIQWFVVSVAHLYNAARQAGGLDIEWPDLEFIINKHGLQRIFHGPRPTKHHEFYSRFVLATCVSSQYRASDYRRKPKQSTLPLVSRARREKRGLQPAFPLEQTIDDFQRSTHKDERWLQRHAVFNCLHKHQTTSKDETTQDTNESANKLQNKFQSLANNLYPRPSKKKSKMPMRILKHDFSAEDDTYPDLLMHMAHELQANELHASFDYLSFFRRAYALLFRIREEVLLVGTSLGSRDINEAELRNQAMIFELFRDLKVAPKKEGRSEGEKEAGDDKAVGVQPIDELKRIAEMMREVVQEQGSVELGRAELRKNREWSKLKASYAAEATGE